MSAGRHYLIRESVAPTPGRHGSYIRLGLLEVEPGVESVAMISTHARGVVRVVKTWERLNAGTSARCAAARARVEAEELKAELERRRDLLLDYLADPVSVSGWGSALYARGVTFSPTTEGRGLRARVLEALEAGARVLLSGCPMAGGNHGSTSRSIVWRGGRLVTRTITDDGQAVDETTTEGESKP